MEAAQQAHQEQVQALENELSVVRKQAEQARHELAVAQARHAADLAVLRGELDRQVISITHLPQIAAMGRHHYKVLKEETEQGTISQMKELNSEQRVEEIAQMLSGSDVSEAALANAKELLRI